MSDPLEDPRAYLQQRVALFTGVSSVFFVGLLGLDFFTPAPGEPLLGTSRIASLVVLAASVAAWAATRSGERPSWVSRALELASTLVAMGAFTLLPLFPPIAGAGGAVAMIMPIPMAVVVLSRAAIIPSPPWLSAAIGLIWGSALTVSGVVAWEGISIAIPGLPADEHSWKLPLVHGVLATVAYSFIAGVVSHVVHGLQTRVRAAMQLGQYTLEAKIGEGGMGMVYRARHRMLRRPTAVKLISPTSAGENAVARFEREVQQTCRLTHPNTVAIFDFGRTRDGVFYYAMEYLDGISLEDLVLMSGPLPSERVIHILLQVAGALGEAHDIGLVHRDVKPDNIVLCERGGVADVVKVLDFGLVKDVRAPADAQLSTADAIKGTPLYLAPEALTRPDAIDGRADLYAVGAVAYFLLVGEPVFGGLVVEVLGHHLHTEPDPPSARYDGIDPQLEAIVMRCLEKEPNRRYQSAADLAAALRACAAADDWTLPRARAWWDRERANVHSRLGHEPVSLTLELAR
jgi:eukaryotic-like serine/threonine-protein kinase